MGKGWRGGIDLVGEMKAANWRFGSASSERVRAADDGARHVGTGSSNAAWKMGCRNCFFRF
jgi:hypothetical protein